MEEIVDFYNRRINYIRISLTKSCNLKCFYCFSEKNLNSKKEEILKDEEILKIVKIVSNFGIEKIRFTGGEPLLRKGIVSLIEKISKLEKIKDFSLTTNGILLKKFAKDLKKAGLKRINISLDSLNPEKYFKITKGGILKDVLEGIDAGKKAGFSPVKINVVVLRGVNENELVSFIKFAQKNSLVVRFIEFMKIGKIKLWEKLFFSEEEIFKKIKDFIEKNSPVQKNEVAKYYTLKDGGEVGIISSVSNRFCSNCNRLRITADGKILPCLFSDEEIDLKKFLRNGDDENKIKEVFLRAVSLKLDSGKCQNMKKRFMFEIGG
jgi:cyclic pyranopterin phosphate synthase